MIRLSSFGACLLLGGLLCLVSACGADRQGQHVRIVLITLDTLRHDSFAGASGSDGSMPHTRALAEGARIFRRAYAATSTTQPTHASLFTGRHPWQHGVPRNGAVLDDSFDTLAERMQARGFETAAVVASFAVHHRFGFGQGFDSFDDEFTVGERRRWNQVEVPGAHFYSMAPTISARALALIDAARADKQFFWFHFFDAHQPYGDSPGGDEITLVELKRELRARGEHAQGLVGDARRFYDRDVRAMDAELERIFARLREDADRIETHVVITSDHGESFGEGGILGHGEHVSRPQIHVPLIIHSPRLAPGVSEVAVGSVDVAATLDALAGGTEVFGVGRDLTQLDDDATDWPVVGMRRTFATPQEDVHTDGSTHRVDGLRFFLVEGERVVRGNAAAVEASGGEPIDAEGARRIQSLFERFEAELSGVEANELLDPETQKALEALGYVR